MNSIEMPDLSGLVKQIDPLLPEVSAEFMQGILDATRPLLAIDKKVGQSLAGSVSPTLSKTVAEVVTMLALANVSQPWMNVSKSLRNATTPQDRGWANEEPDK